MLSWPEPIGIRPFRKQPRRIRRGYPKAKRNSQFRCPFKVFWRSTTRACERSGKRSGAGRKSCKAERSV